MCDIGIGLTLLSAGLGAMGQIQQGKAANASAKYNAKVADMNAKISTSRARDSIERGAVEEQAKRREVAQVKGRQEAALAANGVDIGYGSALDTLVDTATFGELDALTIRSNSYREAYGHDVNAANKTAEGNLSRMEGKAAKQASYIGAAGSLLGGVSDAFGSWQKKKIQGYA